MNHTGLSVAAQAWSMRSAMVVSGCGLSVTG